MPTRRIRLNDGRIIQVVDLGDALGFGSFGADAEMGDQGPAQPSKERES